MSRESFSNMIRISTPEGVVFRMRLASPALRGIAFALDFFCIIALQKCVSMAILLATPLGRDVTQAVSIVCYFAISILYGVVLEWAWNGRTVGKRLLGLRVVDADGLGLRPAQLVVRNLLRIVDAMPGLYMVGGGASLLSSRGQRLGDLAARTCVIRDRRAREPDISRVVQDKYNSFRSHPCVAARARVLVPPEVSDLALRALLRRDSLNPESRAEIYFRLVRCLKSVVVFPQEATDGLSDERYLRNMVDILYRR